MKAYQAGGRFYCCECDHCLEEVLVNRTLLRHPKTEGNPVIGETAIDCWNVGKIFKAPILELEEFDDRSRA